ncbi:hypothetical protein CNR22_00660 [Sphingobacteriaceae bacterium]|nr:hypothetical protein CNR22_00660 [Sphingobacteriaceae bacterium]
MSMHTLSGEREKLKVLVDNSPDFMGMSNNESVVEYLNRAAYDLIGIDKNTDLKSLRSADFYAPHELDRMLMIHATVQKEGSWKGTITLKHFKTGELLPGFASYETVKDPSTGKSIGRSATVRDLRPELEARKKLLKSETTFRQVTQNAPTGLWMSDAEGGLIYLNRTLVDWTGMSYETLLGEGWANAIVEEDRERGASVYRAALNSRTHYDVEFRITKADGSIMWCRASGDPYFNDEGQYAGYVGFCMDVHHRVEMAEKIQQSEQRIKSIVNQAPVAIGVLVGKNYIIESANQSLLNIWGRDEAVIGQPLENALPEIVGQGFIELLNEVYDTGIPYHGKAISVKVLHNHNVKDFFIDFSYTAIRDTYNHSTGILVVATDVTPLVVAKKQAEDNAVFARSILFNSPVSKLVLVGAEMKVDSINEKMQELLGRDASQVGKTFTEMLPELTNSVFMERMLHTFRTGESFTQPEEEITLIRHGQAYTGFYTYIYKALRYASGEIYGIMVTASDITEQVHARQKVEESKIALQGAVDLANLGTFSIDIKERARHYDARMRSWFGFSEDEIITPEKSGLPCEPEELPRLQKAMMDAIAPGSEGTYDVEYKIKNIKTGVRRILHTQGKTFKDANGIPYRISGSSRDVTKEREIELELTRQVQERTEELAATNEELAASNEELQAMNEEMTATNEEMEEANISLNRSNEELSQYAYVASHDLQEPLRKIRVYAGMLDKQSNLPDESKSLVKKINKSSERMTLLIKDLLEFSRVLKQEISLTPVNLNGILKEVVTDFELIATEKNAEIHVGPLPVINALALQMNQLFYNLLNNALKFTDPSRTPVVTIKSTDLSEQETKLYIHKPLVGEKYYKITVSDNGIGFDIQFAEQIFEVFKRLHSKDIYPGSGIGLALCRRIVMNHGGHLFAESEPGVGTIFNIVLHGPAN